MAADPLASPEFSARRGPMTVRGRPVKPGRREVCDSSPLAALCEERHKRSLRFGVSGGKLPGLEKLEVLESHARA
jgi:hypothetical protein